MPDLKITDKDERSLILNALISHAHKCKDTIKLHEQTKDALKTNAIELTATRAKNELQSALTMIAKYYGVHLGGSKFYCLSCAPSAGAEHDRMIEADFAWMNECTQCGNGAYYFVKPDLE